MRLAIASLATAAIVAATAATRGAPSPCAADANYQRLAFWIGDWEVVDSTGAHYATQRVRAAVDGCAITAEWTGKDGNKGLNLSAYDRRSGEWRQVYIANQLPSPSGVTIRRSDPTYDGPGLRFIALTEPAPGDRSRFRVTILPMAGHRVLQLFETSSDGGLTWRTQFRAEHRRP
jgi:hypothetical protein